ncbi:MAG TPA: hypothetical protein VK590_16200, partial [Saprospiraceae bacterium]|nr:hypothetical protein [Saprospiraceae bacterium]
MSLSFQPLVPVCVKDPRVMLEQQRTYAVLKSGSQTSWKQYTTTSISNSSLQFSCPPPSGSVIVDRKMYLYLPVRLIFTGIPPLGQSILMPNRDAPRAFPVSSSIDTLQASINNQSVSINIADIVQALLHYNTDNDLKNLDYSMTPSYQDQTQNYGDGFLGTRNPLGLYSQNGDGTQAARGSFPYTIVSNPVQVGAALLTSVVDIVFCEPLFLSPFYWGKSNECGFYNVNTMDFNITFLSQAANRMWSHDDNGGTNVILSTSYIFGGLAGGPTSSTPGGNMPLMLFQYITPQETQIIPTNAPITYSYFDILRFPSDLPAAPSGSLITYQSNNIQLNSIPRRMYVFIRERNQDLFSNPSHTDSFFQISNVSIQFQNKNGLLASAGINQLYQMSVKNHCKMSWNQWSGGPCFENDLITRVGTIGSVVCIEFATDIGLDALQAPGVLSQSMVQVQVNATNISGHTINPTLYIVPIMEGTFTIQGLGQASTNVGVITAKDILDCQDQPGVSYADVENVSG